MVAGRTTEGRSVTATTTNAAATLTAAAGTFNEEDAGRSVSAASGLQAGSTILSVQSDTAATLSLNANASGSRTITIGAADTPLASGQRYGFIGWSPETDTESEAYTLAANNAGTVPPDRIVDTFTAVTTKRRARG
jgi:hypothetical protein